MRFGSALLIALGLVGSARVRAADCESAKAHGDLVELFRDGSSYYDIYDKFIANFSWHRQLRARLVRAMPAGHLFIDAGGGTGLVAVDLARSQPDAEIHVVDISDDMLAFARRRSDDMFALSRERRLKVDKADLRDLRLDGQRPAAGSVDGFTWNNSLYFLTVDEVRGVLRDMYAMLRPGGQVAVSSVRRLGPLAQTGVKVRGMFELLGMVVKGTLQRSDVPVIVSTTKKIAASAQTTTLSAAEMAALGREAGFEALEEDDAAYGGLNFFVVLRKPLG